MKVGSWTSSSISQEFRDIGGKQMGVRGQFLFMNQQIKVIFVDLATDDGLMARNNMLRKVSSVWI
jgi:hypothetical protein